MIYNAIVNKKDIKKFEKIAIESEKHARLAIKKSDQLHAILSLFEYKSGKKQEHLSIDSLFKKLKIS